MHDYYRLLCLAPSDDCYFSYRFFNEYFDSLHLALKFFVLYANKDAGFAIFKGDKLVARSYGL